MKMRKVLTAGAVLLLTLTIMLVSSGCSAETALRNGGFEESASSAAGWEQYNYQKSAGDPDCTVFSVVPDGAEGNCLKITNTRKNDARIYQELAVDGSSYYKVTLQVKTENVDEGLDDKSRGAGFSISAIDAAKRSSGIFGTTDGWQTVTVYLETGKGQDTMKLSIGLGGYSAESVGTVYIDNIQLEKVKSVPSGAELVDVSPSQSKRSSLGTPLIFQLLFAAVVIGTLIYAVLLARKTDQEHYGKKLPLSETFPRPGKRDAMIMLIMVVICSVMSFANLGDTSAASNFWKAASIGDYVIVEFPETTKVTRAMYSSNIPTGGSYQVSYEKEEEPGTFVRAFTISKGDFFEWSNANANFTAKRVKVEATAAGLAVNELGFFRTNAENEYERIPVTITETHTAEEGTGEGGNPANLFDEQETVPVYRTYMNGTYFDEIYFPRTAYENIHGYDVYETTHPPLGKLFISVGIRLFGMNPFGWRFMGTLFGILMVPLMYLFGLKLFKQRQYAFIAAFLMMFDFMRLAQTRLATIDSYSAFFTIAMYYFMYDYFTSKSYEKPFWKSVLPLAFCGLMFGLGAASKWTCLYAGGGLAILFFLAKYLEAEDSVSGRLQIPQGKQSWLSGNFLPTCLLCVLFFIVIPGIIYVLSYIPYMAAEPDKSLWDIVIGNQEYMYSYHSTLDATHPYGSSWWSWPIIMRPIWYYSGSGSGLPADMTSTIVSMGNPAVWWMGLLAIFPAAYFAWKRRDKGMILVFVAFGMQYFPWILVTRVAFIYHYFTAVPFLIFMLVYCIKHLREEKIVSKYAVGIYLGIVLVLFILFYPALTGMAVKKSYVTDVLRWFSTWTF